MASTIEEAFLRLQNLFNEHSKLERELEELMAADSSIQMYRKGRYYLRRIREKREQIKFYLANDLLRYPPHHYARHIQQLRRFHQEFPYDKSVFVMTKFPDGNGSKDIALRSVIDKVRRAVKTAGYTPRLAADGEYHDGLWDNVELHLLGCCMGIAIVEDHYKPELNPNVALEWGWMKGMGKKVFFLMEQQFAQRRADWQGLIWKTFDWKPPHKGIREAISEWLPRQR